MVNLESLRNEMEALTFQAQQLVIYTIRAAMQKSPQLSKVILNPEGFEFHWGSWKFTPAHADLADTPVAIADLIHELDEIQTIVECKAPRFMKPIEFAQNGMTYLG